MYTRILVPLDGSELAEQVLPYVGFLAGRLQSKIELLHVAEAARHGAPDILRREDQDSLVAGMSEQARRYLAHHVATLEGQGLSVAATVSTKTHVAEAIVREAGTDPGTLAVISARGGSGFARWLLGGVADKVLRGATTPILVFRPTKGPPSGARPAVENLVVPLDGSPLAEQVLPHVVALAGALSPAVTLVRAVSEAVTGPGFRMPDAFHDQIVEASTTRARDYLRQVETRLRAQGLKSVRLHVAVGQPAQVVVDAANELPRSLVAITSHGQSGLRHWHLGGVARRIVDHAACPVLVVRVQRTTPP